MNCPRCGNILKEGSKFCPACNLGINEQQSKTSEERQETEQSIGQEVVNQNTQKNTYQQPYQAPQNAQPVITSGPEDVKANRGYAILSYLGILFLIPYYTKKNSEYAQYHTEQGMLLFILSVICTVVLCILNYVCGMVTGFAGALLIGVIGFLQTCTSVGTLVLTILGIVNAIQGKMNPLPLIGKLSLKK